MQTSLPGQPGERKSRQTRWILWAAIFVSIFIYAFVGAMLKQTLEKPPSADILPLIIPVLIAISAGETAMVLFVLGKLLAKKSNYLSYCVVRWALAESIAIFGLVILILGAEMKTSLLFFAWSAVLLFLTMPGQNDERKFADLANRLPPIAI